MARSDPAMKADAPSWGELATGCALTVVKLAPDGSEAARYPGRVIATVDEGRWIVVRATWTYHIVELDGLAFHPGDLLLEWFSPDHPFNAFAVFSATREFRGWYANVTKPAYLEPGTAINDPPVLVWHDLYLDLVGLPGGAFIMRDEDELEASSLRDRDPGLHQKIVSASHELERRFVRSLLPFVAKERLATLLDVDR
jgi:hypothetical protein